MTLALAPPATTVAPKTGHLPKADHARSSSPVKILLVDDQPSNLLVLETVLEGTAHTLVKARSGQEALKCLLEDDFAVILLDVFMPEMDGFETAQFIRQRKRCRCTPIIFLTAMGMTDTHVSRGYSVGGVDYLFKPIVPEILQAKVAAFVDLFLKTAMVAEQANQLRTMERLRHEAELAEVQRKLEAEKLQHDLRAARKVQQLLFPHQAPSYPGLDISGASYPAEATGGDYFDFIPTPEGLLDVVIGDVSGHGLGPALFMCSTRAYLRALVLAGTPLDKVLTLINSALWADMDGDHFVTLFHARLRQQPLSLSYASAGHLPGYVLNAAGDVTATLESTAVPLGVFPDDDFPVAPSVELRSGDLIFLLTDGVIEAANAAGEFFGADRALRIVREHRSRSAAEIVETLYKAVSAFTHLPAPPDDVTALVIKVA